MEELIGRVAGAAGIDAKVAEKAIGIIVHLMRSHGDPAKAEALLDRLPGAGALADLHGTAASAGGGILGLLGGSMGGLMGAAAKLQAAGLSMEQIRATGTEVLAFAREKAGPDLVKEVAASIPGLSAYV
jgi:ribosomal protein L13E